MWIKRAAGFCEKVFGFFNRVGMKYMMVVEFCVVEVLGIYGYMVRKGMQKKTKDDMQTRPHISDKCS